ncbi:MAG: histidine kinase [Deltaproteobacteria bacterium]|nr:histidine kinase [Deltaproteobacteria bacterium]
MSRRHPRSFAPVAWAVFALTCALPQPGARADDIPRQATLWLEAGAPSSIAQTPDGFLWVGGTEGLHRFDGIAFVPIEAVGVNVRRLLATRTGELWVATGGGRLEAFDTQPINISWRDSSPAVFHMRSDRQWETNLKLPLGNPWVWSMAEASDGTLAFGGEDGVDVRSGGDWGRIEGARLPSRLVTSVWFEDAHTLWVGTSAGLAIAKRTRANEWQVQAAPSPLADASIWSVTSASNNGVWVLTTRHLFKVQRTDPAAFTVETTLDKTMAASVIMQDQRDNVWLGGTDGLTRLIDGKQQVVTAPSLQAAIHVDVLFADREHNVWVASRALSALAQLRPARARNLGADEGLSNAVSFGVVTTPSGEIWTSTPRGLSHVSVSGDVTNYYSGQELANVQMVRSIALAPDGALWASAMHSLIKQTGASFQTIPVVIPSPEKGTHINGLLFSRRGDLWLTWSDDGVTRFDGSQVEKGGHHLGQADGLCAGGFEFVYEGPTGTLWFGGKYPSRGGVEGRLSFYKDGRFGCWSAAQGLPGGDLLDVSEETDGTLWLAQRDPAGLARYRHGQTRILPQASGAPRGPYFSVTDDHAGHLWVTSSHGVFRFTKSEVNDYLDGKIQHIFPYVANARTGMRSEDCISAFQPRTAFDPKGWLWVRTLRGLSAIAPPDEVPGPVAQPVIDEVRVRGTPVSVTGARVVAPAKDPVEFRFTAPTFLDARDLRFSYRLAGLQDTFVEAGAGRAALYAAVPPGRYTFEVRSTSTSQAANSPVNTAKLMLVVTPPYHATWWFRAAVALGLLGVVFAFYRARVARLRMRYALVEQERARIARDLHDDLAQGFLAVGLMLDGLKTRLGRLQDLPDSLLRILEDARGALTETRDNARRAIWNIRAESANRPSLAKLLEAQAAQVRRETRADVTLQLDGPPAPRSAILEYEVPRILKEAATNAIRHGKAKHITVHMQCNEGGLKLTITDDGQGLPSTGTTGRGVGVVGMGERAAQLGGQLTVSPAPVGSGVQVQLTITNQALKALEEHPQ